ncbi:hypothetical protein PAAG_12117 [Paracoccidioides lutzii Pb01]|uniref:Uncharacterized protein n=1 Tax=Paracoccidioides lutzii (strain ATCC MYA-826 / Pb01) TaxID=502779 RepID=A0A0A2V137_PARBA|nr:hypothetical protein PAAG_12117 [Paracoccidioides lutzii Pb01]KGQ01173.1 hypothetical protein PAAG_12117 [Paracoccidioides lutzii Pb01]
MRNDRWKPGTEIVAGFCILGLATQYHPEAFPAQWLTGKKNARTASGTARHGTSHLVYRADT